MKTFLMCAKTQRKLLVKFNVEFKAKRYLNREKKRLMIFFLIFFFQFGVEPSLSDFRMPTPILSFPAILNFHLSTKKATPFFKTKK